VKVTFALREAAVCVMTVMVTMCDLVSILIMTFNDIDNNVS
jgi:hypothetical protein